MGNQTLFRGPLVNAGSLINATTQGEVVTPFDGPFISYQGKVVPDVRQPPLAKDALIPGSVPVFYGGPLFISYDGIPQSIASNQISTNAVFTVGALRNLNTTTGSSALADNAQQITYGLPIIPQGTTQVVNVLGIDYGFATGTTVAASTAVVVTDTRWFAVGQWLAIGGVGNTASNTALIARVVAIPNATTIQLSSAAGTGRARAPIGMAAFFGQGLTPEANVYVPAVTPASITPYFPAGLAAVFDSRYGAGRNLSVSGGTNGVITVSGYDVYGNAMTESITAVGTTAWGRKAFKYVRSILTTTDGSVGSVGLGETFGFSWRSDSWGLINVGLDNKASIGTTTGYTSAILGPSTATTGDVRGTVQINTGSLVTGIFGQAITGTSRLTIAQDLNPAQIIYSNPLGYTALFGVAQA
jgi:hypothetical protein